MQEVTNNTSSINSEIDAMQIGTTEMDGKYLTFWTDAQLFGVPIADVVQIVGMQSITKIPDFPEYAKGIINLRGAIIPLIDVRLRFHKEEQEYNERTCIIVTNINSNNVGFIVDEVDEVTTIDDSMISPSPKISNEVSNTYITGVGRKENKIILLLDTTKMLSEEIMRTIVQASEPTPN